MTTRNETWLGMNWIRQEKRLAIYLRDGCACAWCGASTEAGAQLTLDHIQPHSKGGSNEATNLVTACHACNTSRGNRSAKTFAAAVAKYRGLDAASVLSFIGKTSKRAIDVGAAKALIAQRGSAARVIAAR